MFKAVEAKTQILEDPSKRDWNKSFDLNALPVFWVPGRFALDILWPPLAAARAEAEAEGLALEDGLLLLRGDAQSLPFREKQLDSCYNCFSTRWTWTADASSQQQLQVISIVMYKEYMRDHSEWKRNKEWKRKMKEAEDQKIVKFEQICPCSEYQGFCLVGPGHPQGMLPFCSSSANNLKVVSKVSQVQDAEKALSNIRFALRQIWLRAVASHW